MKQNEEEVQYYYDSSADQWWCYDEQQQCWVPWEEEESDGVKGTTEQSTAAAGVTDAATPDGASSASSHATTRDNAGGLPAVSGSAEDKASEASGTTASVSPGTIESETQRGRESTSFDTAAAAAAGGAANSTIAAAKKSGVEDTTTRAITSAAGVVDAETGDTRSVDGDGRAVKERNIPTAAGAAAATPSVQFEGEAGTDAQKTSNNSRREECDIKRPAETGEDARSREGDGDGYRKEKEDKLQRENSKGDKNEETDKEEEESEQAVNRLRSALESLATTPCLDEALLHMSSSSSLATLGTLSLTGRDTFSGRQQTGGVEQTLPGEILAQPRRDGLKKMVSLQQGMSKTSSGDQKSAEENDEDEDDDALGELKDQIKQDPIVRRSTRMLTFKDKGGLSGCLREAAKQRSVMIREAGGYIPGTEQYRQEAWKQRARELASQTHERSQKKWQEAAKKVFITSLAKPPPGRATHFSDVVERIRRKSETDKDKSAATQAGTSQPSDTSASTVVTPAKSRHSVGPEHFAANFLLKQDIDLREQRRKSSGFPGGQQGHVRFADAAFRDPNSQLQMKDLLTQQSRRKPTLGEEDLALSAAEAVRKEYQHEEGE